MFIYNPTDRISAKQILRHPYFDDLDKKELPASDYDGTLVLPSPTGVDENSYPS
jgi:hypothetical protein